jgi:hypothetical protein
MVSESAASVAARAILALLRKHPGLKSGEIVAALPLRRASVLAGIRRLSTEGAITSGPWEAGHAREWTVAVPVETRPVAPVAPPDSPASEPPPGPSPSPGPERGREPGTCPSVTGRGETRPVPVDAPEPPRGLAALPPSWRAFLDRPDEELEGDMK